MMPLNPLHHNLSIRFLHTLFYTFLLVLTRRIGLTIKVSFESVMLGMRRQIVNSHPESVIKHC